MPQLNQLPRIAAQRAHALRRGTAILPALIVVVMVATLSMVYVQMSLSKNKEQRVSVDSKRAFYMAEAGLAEGFNGLCMGKSGNVASEDVPAEFGAGLFWTKATELGNGRVKLESTGLAGAGRATLAITCERSSDQVGSLGFFGGNRTSVEGGATIDSYDSRFGTYASQALTAALALPGTRVGGNGDISVQGSLRTPTYIYGDVSPGPAGTLLQSALGVTITGSRSPSPATVALPAVKLPFKPGTLRMEVVASRNMPTGAYGMDTLRVGTGATLLITGPQVIVANEIRVDAGGKLAIDATNGPVKIYTTNLLRFDAGSVVNTGSTDPSGVTFQSTGTVELGATGDFYGTLYSPSSAVVLPAGFNVYGSVVADSLLVAAGARLHYDRALSATSDGNGASHLLGWHIVELPNVGIVKLRYDALADLVSRGITPRRATDGHFDIGVTPD
jgi:hypothetical protein